MALLDPILSPLLGIDPLYAIVIISGFLSLASILASKYFTNQAKMKQHKLDMKAIQKKSQALSKSDPSKAMSMQKEMMDMNMVIMKESFKPMFITIIPFLLVFAWLNANLSFIPIEATEPFTITADMKIDEGLVSVRVIPEDKITYISNQTTEIVDKKVSWELSGDAAHYTIQYSYNNETVEQDLIIGDTYETPLKAHSASSFKKTTIGNEPLRVKLLGLEMKWIWSYVLFSLMFSIIFRKLMNVA